jgi:hypothetical protein
LFFVFIFNVLAVPIATGMLDPFSGLLLNPMIATAAMSISSVLVVTSALRLRRSNCDQRSLCHGPAVYRRGGIGHYLWEPRSCRFTPCGTPGRRNIATALLIAEAAMF